MITDDAEHTACVASWMDRVAKDVPPEHLVRAFDRGFACLWRRAHQTLGDVTLTAIVDRVLYTAAEQFPFLGALKIESNGLRCHDLHERAPTLGRGEIAVGIRFFLIEFLRVLGNLTAEILTPALHAELSKVDPEETRSSADERALSGDPRKPSRHGEDPEP